MQNKTDKQLVWETIKEIELRTPYGGAFFYMPDESVWADHSNETKLKIRALMLDSGIVSIYNNNPWAFQLTAKGMLLKESDLRENGELKKKNSYKQFWLGVIAALIGAVISTGLSAILEVWKAHNLQPPPATTVVLPKIQIVHDTAFFSKTAKGKH